MRSLLPAVALLAAVPASADIPGSFRAFVEPAQAREICRTARDLAEAAPPAPSTPEQRAALDELVCRDDVREALGRIHEETRRDRREHGLRIDRTPLGGIVIRFMPAGARGCVPVSLNRRTTLAIAHTHPAPGDPRPSRADMDAPVPNLVVTDELWVTDPGRFDRGERGEPDCGSAGRAACYRVRRSWRAACR